jgi:hypothetical protein
MEGGDTWEPGVGGGADTRESHADGEEAGTRKQVPPPPLSLLLVLECCQPRLDFNRGGVGLKLRELTLQ